MPFHHGRCHDLKTVMSIDMIETARLAGRITDLDDYLQINLRPRRCR
jgi:hypothetical protein